MGMDPAMLRRTGALLVSAALLASLTVVTVAAPTAAQLPTCDGQPATITGSGVIVGTDGDDVIVGSDGNDIIEAGAGNDTICGGPGFDTILGEGGRDRIFGGSGDDVMDGGPGPDDLFGFKGNDFILGKGGNDFIDGGTGIDNCQQGAGSGPVKNCERADLKVRVIGPGSPSPSSFTFKVTVRNVGPDASGYNLFLEESNGGTADCDFPGEDQTITFSELKPQGVRTRSYQMTCSDVQPGAQVEIKAEVFTFARDPRLGNNRGSSGSIAIR
jgi:hypothetical protein